jgi:hypothetical protein
MKVFAARAFLTAFLGFMVLMGLAIWLQRLGAEYSYWVDVLSLVAFVIFFVAGSIGVVFRGK